MNKKTFYILINRLYFMSPLIFQNHIKKNIINTNWFKKACKEKRIKVYFLSKKIINTKKAYFKKKSNSIFYSKYSMIQFIFEELEGNNHLKLLNINLRNESLFNTVNLLICIQNKFLNTKHFRDLLFIKRKDFIESYRIKYNKYIDLSILSKMLNNTYFKIESENFKLEELIPQKLFIYSLLIREVISKYDNLTSDTNISIKLNLDFNVTLCRRKVNYIRNKYLIINKNRNSSIKKSFSTYRKLNRKNITLIDKKTTGIYEISTKKDFLYPYLKSDIIYIGSSNNLKKRLYNYIHQNKIHNKDFRFFAIKNLKKLYFRTLKTKLYREYEKYFLDSFIEDYGALPLLNKQRILKKHFDLYF